ncbi:MAG TPA: LPS assembly protein LptD [Alphaproteobacteria bacterium]|nr:LPS assembly protein LptD [Alphaproteobacteria bacterium]
MPRRPSRASARLAYVGIATIAWSVASATYAQQARHGGQQDKNVVLTADKVTRDAINDTVTASGHVEFVQGENMLLADRVIWNQSTDIVTATGSVKLVNELGNIYFGDYLEITDDMREGFIRNVSMLMADNSRMVGNQAQKEGEITTINRAVYSPCELCKDDPSKPPTWQITAAKVIHDSDEKRVYYHDATFSIDGFPVAWTPYFSTYDPSVKRADGILETLPGYRSQLGFFVRSTYYVDIAPDKDAVIEAGEFTQQGPLIGGQYRERFSDGQIQLSGSITESDIRQYPTPLNIDEKTVRGHFFGNGEFDLDDNWRMGFDIMRSLDNLYVLKYGYSSMQVLPSDVYMEGFFGRDYINGSLYSFQDLRPFINGTQPVALPYVHYSFFGDPGQTLGGRWADSGSLLFLAQYPGQHVYRLANNVSWERELISDSGLVTNLNASVETDYYRTNDPLVDPISQLKPAKSAARVFPQAYAVVSYPFVKQIDYAQLIVEPIVSFVGAPAHANNQRIPNEDSQDIQLDPANLFSGNRFPGVDRMDDGTRVTYGVKTGLYNLGTGYSSIFFGQTYRITGDAIFPPNSGLQTRFSDYVGQIEIYPGRLFDIDYRFELSNDFKQDRLQEINFKIGPDDYGIFGTYLFAEAINAPNFVTSERNELTLAVYYKFDPHWSIMGAETSELSQPRAVLRYGLAFGYQDDCSAFTLNVAHDQTLPVGGTSGTAVFLKFSLKNLGVFNSPSIH